MPHQDGLFFRVLRRVNMVLMTVVLLCAVGFAGLVVLMTPKVQAALGALVGKPAEAPKPVSAAPTFHPQAEWFPTADHYPPYARDKILYVLKKTVPGALVIQPADLAAPAEPPSEDVNIMIIDEKTGDASWLFKGNDQVILERDAIYDGPQPIGAVVGTDPRPIIAMVLQVVEDDTNNDGKLDANDDVTLYLWRKDSPKLVKLLTSEGSAGVGLAGKDRYLVNYGKDHKDRIAAFSVPDFELIYDKPLPELPR